MRRFFKVAVLAMSCFLFWNILSLDFSAPSLVGALVLSILAAWYSASTFYEHNPLQAAMTIYRVDLLAVYFVTVLLQSYVAAFELIWRMLTRRYRPGLVRVRTRLRSSLGRAVLANSISLVPGTLSLWMEDHHIYVHWFDLKTTHGVRAGHLTKQQIETHLARIFG